jgi:hypothetical protein
MMKRPKGACCRAADENGQLGVPERMVPNSSGVQGFDRLEMARGPIAIPVV